MDNDVYKILVVEDDVGLVFLIKKELKKHGYNVESVESGEEAVTWCTQNPNSLLLLDYKLPDISARDVINEINKHNTTTYFIIITGYGDIKVAVEMMKLGVKDYVIKDANFLNFLPNVVNRVINELDKEKRLMITEEAFRRSEEKYRLLAECIVDVIWITDLDFKISYVNQSISKLLGYHPDELINKYLDTIFTKESMKNANAHFTHLFNNFKNIRMQNFENESIVLELQKKDTKTIWVEIKFSFMFDDKQNVCGLLGVTRDITERRVAEKKLKESYQKLRMALEASVEAMGKATEIRDPYTAGHQKRVGQLSYKIARAMKLPEERCEGVRLSGAIHDIGKIYVPAEILSKPGSISDNEFNIIKTHSQVGYDILKKIEFPWPIAETILQHHERIDGSGYPQGLQNNNILLEAKIISVADVVEAMASYRPYRPALGIERAIDEIKKNRDKLYDPHIVDICCKIILEEGFNFEE